MKNRLSVWVLLGFPIYAFSQNSVAKDPSAPNAAIADSIKLKADEQAPTYPGGNDALCRFIEKKMRYPGVARKANIQGTVIVSFIIDKEGAIHDVRTTRSLSPECDAEAERMIKAMPRWNPGTLNGKPVLVRYNFPILFKLK